MNVEEDGKNSWRDMKKLGGTTNAIRKKRSLMDLIWIKNKNWIAHILRGESLLRKVIGVDDRKKTKGKETIGYAT